MTREDIALQIKKYKSRRLKSRLAHYGTSTSIFLALSIFANGVTLSAFYSFALFAPVLAYFLLESYKFAKKSHKIKLRLSELESLTYSLSPTFSITKFFSQQSFTFRLTLILFILVLFTSLARIRSSDARLSASLDTNTYNQR